jgi:hypothetical protein
VHAQICVQGSAATAGLLCMLGAVIIFTKCCCTAGTKSAMLRAPQATLAIVAQFNPAAAVMRCARNQPTIWLVL